MDDIFNLQRFVDAQDNVYKNVKRELARGAKTSHWMWFVFPQVRGLGSSAMATKFGISGLDEARAYLAHPVLGARLRECTTLVLQVHGKSLNQIFGNPDDLKFRSSMTLFAVGSEGDDLFNEALEQYCSGQKDARTLHLLR